MSGVREHDIDVEGLRLHGVETGAGEPILVLHGFTGDAESMESVSAGLQSSYRVIRLELVGHGQSDAPEDPAHYAMPACARDIASVADELGLERPHLLGYSMGGRAALASVVAAPDRFASLVLVGATAGIADSVQREQRIAADEALAASILRDGLERFVDDWMALPLFSSQARLGEAALARARVQRLRNRPTGLAMSLRGMGAGAQPPLFDALDRVAIPTLLVVGDEDEKFKAIAGELEARLPDARIATLDAAGHAAHLEAPDAFARVVDRFLGDTVRRSDAARASRAGDRA